MSAIRSDGYSIPIERRMVESRTPIFRRMSGGNAGVGHACREAGERLGAAEAHRQLEDLERVEKLECRGLTADDAERERRAGTGALPGENTAGRGALFVVTQIMDLRHLGMIAQVIGYEPRIA